VGWSGISDSEIAGVQPDRRCGTRQPLNTNARTAALHDVSTDSAASGATLNNDRISSRVAVRIAVKKQKRATRKPLI
jgi:hypothetical protein